MKYLILLAFLLSSCVHQRMVKLQGILLEHTTTQDKFRCDTFHWIKVGLSDTITTVVGHCGVLNHSVHLGKRVKIVAESTSVAAGNKIISFEYLEDSNGTKSE